MSGGRGRKSGERESKQAPCFQPEPNAGLDPMKPETVTYPEIKSWMLSQLSHPGAPAMTCVLFLLWSTFFSFLFLMNIIYCQIGLHSTPSAHPNKCPPQRPSPALPFSPTPPSILNLFSVFKSLLWFASLPLCLYLFPLPFPQVLVFSFSRSTYEWKHMISVLVWLTYFTQHNTFQFHPHWCKWPNFILIAK